jgi:hypothetical protein
MDGHDPNTAVTPVRNPRRQRLVVLASVVLASVVLASVVLASVVKYPPVAARSAKSSAVSPARRIGEKPEQVMFF